ncbi:MAG: HEPN domain-containing protein [Candidatus Sumerlaeota bacterium]|nr:HEPN domain-containing protein [Candidatus Sumerlaeota bacterium]
MALDNKDTGSAEEWLRYAQADLAFARAPLPKGGMYEQLCFHAQQAAEKALKSVLVSRQIKFPFTHNLQTLINMLPLDLELPPVMATASELTEYATVFRYPGEEELISKKEYRQALRTAAAIVKWGRQQIRIKKRN